jgi:hypothetical protein
LGENVAQKVEERNSQLSPTKVVEMSNEAGCSPKNN